MDIISTKSQGWKQRIKTWGKRRIIETPLLRRTIVRRLLSWINLPSTRNVLYDIQTIDVINNVLTETSNCIDVGCHKGSVLKEILQVAPKGVHFAFEPIPELYDALVSSFRKFDNVIFYKDALCDTQGQTKFHYVVSNPGYSGLRKRRYDSPDEVINEIMVTTDILDRVIPEKVRINFIKVDVEGAEQLVLRGG